MSIIWKKLCWMICRSVFFINKFYMTRIFKETYGVTINNYLISKRITRSKQLLCFTDMTVDEIGNAVGAGDANYLSRMFRKVEGRLPVIPEEVADVIWVPEVYVTVHR